MTHRTTHLFHPLAFSSAAHFLHASSQRTSFPPQQPPASVMSSFAHHHGSLAEREGRMAALRSSLRPYEAAEEIAAAVVVGSTAWGTVERGVGMLGDGFLVEDLLDLEELCEVDKEGGELCEAPPVAAEDGKSNDSHTSSVVSYELMPLLPPAMDLPAHDAEELEWVSRIMDDSLAELPPPPQFRAVPSEVCPPQHRRPEEAAVLAADRMRTPPICALSTEASVPVRAKRSKRSRAAVWSLTGSSLSDSMSSSTNTTSSSSSSTSLSSFFLLDSPTFAAHADLLEEPPRPKKSKHGKNGKQKPKKRGRKPKYHFPPQLAVHVPGDRRCSHCGVQKTPQWRAGPEGAKTLCNACGVRYKSGRLLPEYRPAVSPTFVGTLHSNSHRKVLEMRRKKDPVIFSGVPAVASF